MLPKKILFVANSVWYLWNFRHSLMLELKAAGYEVVAVAPTGQERGNFEEAGITFIPLKIDSQGVNPFGDLLLLFRLHGLFRKEKPDLCVAFTSKPNIYGGLACRLLGVPCINNVTGLGSMFIQVSLITRIMKNLYRLGLKGAHTVFFQNPHDSELFLKEGIVRREQIHLVPGSGIDLKKFTLHPMRSTGFETPFRFLLVARMLWDKGIGEFIAAVRILRSRGISVEAQLLGFVGAKNPTAIGFDQIEAWQREGLIKYLGAVSDVRGPMINSDCVVLPSYREGTPRSLLEAASLGRPIITTNVPGCNEVVDDQVNGFLCESHSAEHLADKMERMVSLPMDQLERLGENGRAKMEQKFDQEYVFSSYFARIEDILT